MSSDSARKRRAEARIPLFDVDADGLATANPIRLIGCVLFGVSEKLCLHWGCAHFSPLLIWSLMKVLPCGQLRFQRLIPDSPQKNIIYQDGGITVDVEMEFVSGCQLIICDNMVFNETCHGRTKATHNAISQSCCNLSPLPKESSLKLQNTELKDVGVLGLGFERPYIISCGKYMVREAVLDEEYWAAAWLRAEIHSEGHSYVRDVCNRYIEIYQKKFAEQEFTSLRRRCLEKQGPYLKCICLVAVASEGFQNEVGLISQLSLRDRVIGTLDVSIRHLVRAENLPKDPSNSGLFNLLRPERRCGYIANVCVTKLARRQGIASSLLEVAIKAAKSWKLKDLCVHVAINNTAAQQLYTKAGFQVVEDTSELSLRAEQLLCMCI